MHAQYLQCSAFIPAAFARRSGCSNVRNIRAVFDALSMFATFQKSRNILPFQIKFSIRYTWNNYRKFQYKQLHFYIEVLIFRWYNIHIKTRWRIFYAMGCTWKFKKTMMFFRKSKNTALLNGDKANTIYVKMILFIFTFQNLKATLLSNVLLKQLI